MSDPTARLLRWLAAHDTPERVVLLCADATLPRVGRRTLVVQVDGCVTDVGLGLAAQLLASGVAVVEVAPCPTRPEEATATVASWRAVLGDGVAHLTAPRWARPAREVLRLGQVPLPRRVVLGLRIDPVLDLDLDDAARTLAALRLLHRQGRARVVPQTADPGPAASAEVSSASTQVFSGAFFVTRLVLLGLATVVLALFTYRTASAAAQERPQLLTALITAAFVLALAAELMGRSLHYDSMIRIGI